jgi:hypothetical protein
MVKLPGRVDILSGDSGDREHQHYSRHVVAAAVAAIALGLLGLAGMAKMADPTPTVGALRAARLPSSKSVVLILGLVEVAVSVVGLILGGVWAAGGAVLYAGFAAFTWLALRADLPIQSCGCFGREDTPPSWFHFGFNVVSLIALGVVAITGTAVIPIDDSMSTLIAYVVFVAIGVYLAYLLLTRLPQTMALTRTE